MTKRNDTWEALWLEVRHLLRQHAPQVAELAELAQRAADTVGDPGEHRSHLDAFTRALDALHFSMYTALLRPIRPDNLSIRLYSAATPEQRRGDFLHLSYQTHSPFAQEASLKQIRSGEAAVLLREAARCWANGDLHPCLR